VILTQHYLACLSHTSYLIGDETTSRAVIVDPRRDIGIYLDEAAERGLRIERVIETHVHADFVSGHLELAAHTGAVICYGAGADVGFPIEELHDGQRLSLGEVTLQILATPGHTPESICVVVWECPDAPAPHGVLTGDTLFVGDVGRPDLLASAGTDMSAEALARCLYRSLRGKLLVLPDATKVYPAYGAGSACGKALSEETTSTIGEQRRANYALQDMSDSAFVAAVIEGQPARPRYFAFDARANREAHPLLDEHPPELLGLDEVMARQQAGAVLLDTREPADFAMAHLAGAVNIGLQGRFAEWAGDVLPPESDIVLVGDPVLAAEAKLRLARVGLDRVAGQLADPAGVFSGRPELVEASSRLTIGQLAELRGLEPDLQLVDVRGAAETANGTLPKAVEIPLAVFADSIGALDRDLPVVIYCASGYRSQAAASVLAAAGFQDVCNLLGGYRAWHAAGLPVAYDRDHLRASRTPQVSARTAHALLEAGTVLLDVREPGEWQEGHAPGAVLIPMGDAQVRRRELGGGKRIVVVCRSGGRSAAITGVLRAHGYDAINLTGGMCAWTAAGLPVVTQAMAHINPDDAYHQALTHGMVVHRSDPLNCETSLPALIGGVIMPNARFYVRNHFRAPTLDASTWRLEVSGMVERPLTLGLRELTRMPSESRVVTLECAGNGRFSLNPPVDGEPWRLGAVSTAEWTGVPLTEVLDRAGIVPGAREAVFRGADRGAVQGHAGAACFERSLPLGTARESQALLAYAMNGEPLPLQHGYPVRLVVPSWYGVASVKWLTAIELADRPFDGYFQTTKYWYQTDGTAREPVTLQQVRALITDPRDGEELSPGEITVRGVAWSGAAPIARVEVSINEASWQEARLIGDRHRHSWQWWELLTTLAQPGKNSIRARATDLAGRTQPSQPQWNRHGYGNNSIQEMLVHVPPPEEPAAPQAGGTSNSAASRQTKATPGGCRPGTSWEGDGICARAVTDAAEQ
jgi:DMSO/TMAO reductase YedYZ molybdopterin-dependent catalytic subunit/rhodanese-related sulfurtransferase/glyoxylase-like metal-dependent hydrolase (beta-lactamase superfamily II)